ncbi:MAG: hypothetical protein WAT62_01700 [Candidatus Nanogingivalis sp.]
MNKNCFVGGFLIQQPSSTIYMVGNDWIIEIPNIISKIILGSYSMINTIAPIEGRMGEH